MIDWE